jgi:hypothetical protein
MEISGPNYLRDIASLGLTLPEAKQLLARVQQAVVAAQARDHAGLRPHCTACGGSCHVKDWRPHQIATLFGGVTVRLRRFLCAGWAWFKTCHFQVYPGSLKIRAAPLPNGSSWILPIR